LWSPFGGEAEDLKHGRQERAVVQVESAGEPFGVSRSRKLGGRWVEEPEAQVEQSSGGATRVEERPLATGKLGAGGTDSQEDQSFKVGEASRRDGFVENDPGDPGAVLASAGAAKGDS